MTLILFVWGFARKKKSLNTFEVQLLGSSPTVACLINLLAGPKVVTRQSQHSSGNCIQPMNWLKTDILSHGKGGVSWWSRWRGGENVRSKRGETLLFFILLLCKRWIWINFAPFSILLFSTISKHKYLAFLLNSEHENFSEKSDTIVQEKTEDMFRECLPPKNIVFQLIHRVECFQCLFQNHSLTFNHNLPKSQCKNWFADTFLFIERKISILSHENNYLVNSWPETLLILVKYPINHIKRLLETLPCCNATLTLNHTKPLLKSMTDGAGFMLLINAYEFVSVLFTKKNLFHWLHKVISNYFKF